MTTESWWDLVDRINRKESLLDFRQVKTMTFVCARKKVYAIRFHTISINYTLSGALNSREKDDSRFRGVKKSKKRDRKFLSGREFWLCPLSPLIPLRAPIDSSTCNSTIVSEWSGPFIKLDYMTLTFQNYYVKLTLWNTMRNSNKKGEKYKKKEEDITSFFCECKYAFHVKGD